MIYIINGKEIEAVNIKVAKSRYKKITGQTCYTAKVKDMSKPKKEKEPLTLEEMERMISKL